ncbi:hypothetical protein CQA49_00250 [Helicobacter sp. MIT 00-7814]|uniref:acylneuraminate cytidylyltransferase family protein n=1 Tax=unclassified Helicobacter TaxID=2593540 RepID=UPI000E1F1792|nr:MULTISPECIES: hypothetical protein [unclassified Helicobacter]RDU57132.1 hypothetical protein CQA49_00250 [Helicobacter sp. MIT 00-7814]RDU57684.1 hypothetical protein CQA37_00250 [Helicobacter sp. MIT 99-10781]
METTAVIVARKGSVRIKSKSLLTLNGQSLIERKITQLQNCKHIDRIVFGSDCEIMLQKAKNCGAEVVERPEYYCDEKKASANEMIANMLELINTDVVVWAHCTNPLISPNTYDKALQIFFENLQNGSHDSLLSVVELREHLWNSDKCTALNYNPYALRHTPAKELTPFFMQDGGIFIQPYTQMKQNSYFFGKRPYLFEIPKDEFLDINDMRDYLLAKALVESYKGGGYKRLHTQTSRLNPYCKIYSTFTHSFSSSLSTKHAA